MNNDNDVDTVIRSNGLRAEQKLAMAVLKLSLDDIRKELPLKAQAWAKNEDLKSAMKLLISGENLEFWCMIAGWPIEAVRAQAQRIVWGMDVKKRGPGRPMQAVVKPQTLYWREWYKRRKQK